MDKLLFMMEDRSQMTFCGKCFCDPLNMHAKKIEAHSTGPLFDAHS